MKTAQSAQRLTLNYDKRVQHTRTHTTHTHTHTRRHAHTHTHTHAHTHTHTHTHHTAVTDWAGKCVYCRFPLKISLIIKHYSAQQPTCNTHSLTHTHSLSLSLTHTHTHTHDGCVSLHMRDSFSVHQPNGVLTDRNPDTVFRTMSLCSLITHIHLDIKLFKKATRY